MIFAELPLAEAEGALLAHGQMVGTARWSKGRRLTADDLAEAARSGLDRLMVARLDADDVAEDAAATALAAALAGGHVEVLPAAHGRANLAARTAGVLAVDPGCVTAVNAIDEALTLGTLAPMARVRAGEIIATVKVIRYAVARPALAAALAASAPMQVHGFRPCDVALVATRLPGVSDKAMAKTLRVTRARVEALGCRLVPLPAVAHDTSALAAVMAGCTAELLLVARASASVDRGDVVPAAMVRAGGHVERPGMPGDPGNLLGLGEVKGRPVIGPPGCARSPRRNGLDLVLERLIAGLPVTAADIAAMGAGGLLPEAERPVPR
ncbi:hypothetical protein GCM10007973_03800 [Polymorphobacter multimanifer]|uniref:molybdopterin biosynthesis enzyme n=1 Tax=Polymorphobacter multimanifer TaxID=1070431 RepID=UPI00166A09DC|nr:molybdopterin biosynthesis enzyme [Polymorphobacter multimanifer]GGI69977.1 hypothetical protein GCM10007973_03800 [Polymorphobacter multimanifer]